MELTRTSYQLVAIAARHAEQIRQSFPHRDNKITLVESKSVNLGHVADLLAQCERCNQWANRGPLYWTLAEAFHDHMNLPAGVVVTPCANGGVALEVLARFHQAKLGRPLRWVGSAFSFANLARGWFAGIQLIDCDLQGMLDLTTLQALDPRVYDGFVVTNIFGLWRDFGSYIDFARKSGKAMLIDNAAGIDSQVPDCPYQSFSLHYSKPYGAGEGGFYLSPREEAKEIYALLNYGAFDRPDGRLWLNNGKISDVACAFHLDRLASHADWAPRYREQAERVEAIAVSLGLRPLVPGPLDRPAMSRPFLAAGEVTFEQVHMSKKLQLGKYYQPLSNCDRTVAIYSRLLNIPTHPDIGLLNDEEILCDLKMLPST